MNYTKETLEMLDKNKLIDLFLDFQETFNSQENQLLFFKKNMFGRKSEKIIADESYQYPLPFPQSPLPEPTIKEEPAKEEIEQEAKKEVKQRVKSKRAEKFYVDENGLQFDNSLTVEEEVILPEEVKGLDASQYEIIGKKESHFLAKRESLYIKKIVRPEVKKKEEPHKIITAKLPDEVTVLENSMFDVSFLASMIEEKYRYHMPLHRQYQKIEATGVRIVRSTLTKQMLLLGDLLKPVYEELKKEILQNHVVMMDETPIKAGRNQEKHVMKNAYFWGIHGDAGTAFTFSPTRNGENVPQILKDFRGVIITDGYEPYTAYCRGHQSIRRAQCWAHVRRKFNNALLAAPNYAKQALLYIHELYKIEEENKGNDEKLAEARNTRSRAIVDEFFKYLRAIAERQSFPDSNLFKKATSYTLNNEEALKVMLEDVKVPLDTNALERDNRFSAVGRKNYMFNWTEEGAECSAIMYSLVASCVQNKIIPAKYFEDILTRIQHHEKSKINLLTPYNWKNTFSKVAQESN